MKRIIFNFIAFSCLLVSVSPLLFAETNNFSEFSSLENLNENDTVVVSLANLPLDESMHFAFMYGIQALLEEKCDAALLTFTTDNEYIAGYLSPNAPDDFCSRISPDTIVVSEPFTREGLLYVYSVIGDRSAISILTNIEDEYLVGVLLFKPYENMTLTPMWYANVENKIKNEAVARGINPDDVYLYLYQKGYSKDSIIASVANGDVNVSQVVVDAINIKDEYTKNTQKTFLEKLNLGTSNVFKIVLIVVSIVLFCLFSYLLLSIIDFATENKKKEKKNKDDNFS